MELSGAFAACPGDEMRGQFGQRDGSVDCLVWHGSPKQKKSGDHPPHSGNYDSRPRTVFPDLATGKNLWEKMRKLAIAKNETIPEECSLTRAEARPERGQRTVGTPQTMVLHGTANPV